MSNSYGSQPPPPAGYRGYDGSQQQPGNQYQQPRQTPPSQQQPRSPARTHYEQPASPYGHQPQQPYGQPGSYAQGQTAYPHQGFVPGAQGGVDPFLMSMAGNVLQQSGSNYLQKGQAFMQSKMGFMSGGLMHYHFSVTGDYVVSKLLMLLAPYLRRWNYTRVAEQIAGGHKYLPPRQDSNAPDLYIPFMAMCTYVILSAATLLAHGKFLPTSIYSSASGASAAWLVHWIIIKAVLYALGIPSAVPFLEVVAYAGYAFVPTCLAIGVGVPFGLWPYRVAWMYGSLCTAIFIVRTMKRVIFHEARHYNMYSTRHNYLLLALGVYQFVHIGWLSWV